MADCECSSFDDALAASVRALGYDSAREHQREAMREFVGGKDVFVCLPTGHGKSLCYAVLPLLFDELRGKDSSIVLCVSPLVSLMVDQRRNFSSRGLSCELVGEAQDNEAVLVNVTEGKYKLVFMSPESLLLSPRWREMLRSPIYQDNLVALAIDEAHLVKKW